MDAKEKDNKLLTVEIITLYTEFNHFVLRYSRREAWQRLHHLF